MEAVLAVNGRKTMGAVRCSRHGLGAMFVCPHVATAVLARSECRGIQYFAYTTDDPELADIKLACWFCPHCIEENRLPLNGTVISNPDEFLNSTSGLFRPMCHECFKEWQDQGLGTR
jgi:hypothetical protein